MPSSATTSVLDDDDLVGVAQCAQPMGDGDDRAAGHQPFQRLDHKVLGLRVQRGSRFVEDQNRVVADQRSGDADALALAAGQRGAAIADQAVVAVGHAVDELVGVGQLGRRNDVVVGGVGAAERDVVADGASQQHRVLQHEADLACAAREACSHRCPPPSIVIRPPSRSRNRGIRLTRVDFPLPVGPTTPTICPASIVNEMSRSTGAAES